MYDLLPFPNITANNIEELRAEANNYLIQLKESLELILQNIGIDNLSSDLVEKLNTMGAEIEKNNEESNDQLQQISNAGLTVSDVINSRSFNSAVNGAIERTNFRVNFETGNLDYGT